MKLPFYLNLATRWQEGGQASWWRAAILRDCQAGKNKTSCKCLSWAGTCQAGWGRGCRERGKTRLRSGSWRWQRAPLSWLFFLYLHFPGYRRFFKPRWKISAHFSVYVSRRRPRAVQHRAYTHPLCLPQRFLSKDLSGN